MKAVSAVRRSHPSSRRRVSGHFANELEREFAQLLDLYGVSWEYEPHEFVLERDELGRVTSSFRPDFFVESLDLYVEITAMRQTLVTRKNGKIRRCRDLYPDLNLEVLYRRDLVDFFSRHGLVLPDAQPRGTA